MSSDDIYGRPKTAWDRIRTVLVGVLVGMLVLAFAVWGIEDVFSPNRSNAVIKVGDAEVGRAEFTERFNNEMRIFAEENGEGITPQQAYERGIPQRLLSEFAQELAIEADAKDLGVGINRRDVRAAMESIDAFRNPITEMFDETQVRQVLANNRITLSQFESDLNNTLTRRQTLPAIMGGIAAPTDYALRYNTFINEIRRARILTLSAAALGEMPEPTDTDLESYIAANPAQFIAPEYRKVLMLRVEPFDFARDIEVTDEQLRARFDTLIGAGQIGSEETRDVSVISVATQEQADLAAARITAGEPIETVVAELNLATPSIFDEIGPDGLLNPASSEAAFEAEEGTARVATTDFGTFEVVAVRSVSPAEVPDFEEMRSELTSDVLSGQARRMIGDFERVVDDSLLEGLTVEQIAEKIEFPLSGYPFIDRLGTTQDGIRLSGFTTIPGIASDDQLLQAVFTTDEGFESDIIPTSNNGFAVFRITEIVESRPQTLEEAREEATASWKAQQINDALTQAGVEIVQRVRDGEEIEAVATDVGAELTEIALQRAAPPNNVSPQVLIGLLDGEVDDVVRGPGVLPETYQIGVLDTISSGGDLIGGQMLDIIRNTVSEQIAIDINRSYLTAIVADKDQQVYEDQMLTALGLEDQIQ